MSDSNKGVVIIDGSSYEFNIEPSKSEYNTLIINGKYIHSKYHPERECENQSYQHKSLIIIFGVGLGYHIKNLLDNNPQSLFIVFDPISSFIDSFLESEKNINNTQVLFLKKIDFDEIYKFIYLKNFTGDNRFQFYSNQGYSALFKNIEFNFFENVKKAYELHIQNILTESNFCYLWVKNFLYNLSNLGETKILSLDKNSSFDTGDNLAVLVCAGPTLIEDINLLRDNRDRFTLFAVDTAIKPLLESGINPDFIFSLDGQIYSLDDFTSILPTDCCLISDMYSYPRLNKLAEKSFFVVNSNMVANNIIEPIFHNLEIMPNMIEISGTVSDMALKFIHSIGFKYLFITGLDLSYPGFVTHCKETPLYKKLFNKQGYFDTIESQFACIISKRNLKQIISKNGNSRFSDFVLYNYVASFEQFAKNNTDIEIYNSQTDGINIDGFINITFSDVIRKYSSTNISGEIIREIFSNREVSISRDKLKSSINKLVDRLYSFSNQVKSLFETTDFEKDENIEKWKILYRDLFYEFPFLRKFIIMTEVVLNRKEIQDDSMLFYKHTSFKLLQSIYYIIRTSQKALKLI